MPFKKQSDGSYKTPNGKKYTRDQVRAYYATDGFSRPKMSKPRKYKSRKRS